MKKKFLLILILFSAFFVVTGCAQKETSKEVPKSEAPQAETKYEKTIGSTRMSSSHYAFALAAAKAINENCPNVKLTVAETSPTHGNIAGVDSGNLIGGYVNIMSELWRAYHGEGQYTGKQKNWMRTFVVYQPVAAYFMVVRADSGIEKMKDLQGKKFSPGIAGSATCSLCMEITQTLGVKPDWFVASVDDAVNALKDKRIVGYCKAAASGNQLDSTMMDLKSTTPIKIIGYSKDEVALVKEKMPWVEWVTIPAGLIKAMPEVSEFTTWSNAAGAFLTKDVPQWVGYEMTKATAKDWQSTIAPTLPGLDKVDPIKDTIKWSMLLPDPLPLHAGFVQYCQEIGMDVPKELIPSEYRGAKK